MGYKTTVEDEHWRAEEFQWARILEQGHPARGMVLVYLQKACTAFHEFEPACKHGALSEKDLEFFKKRLANRIQHVRTTMHNNGLESLQGGPELAGILHSIESARTMGDLAKLADLLHAVGHTLLDALEHPP